MRTVLSNAPILRFIVSKTIEVQSVQSTSRLKITNYIIKRSCTLYSVHKVYLLSISFDNLNKHIITSTPYKIRHKFSLCPVRSMFLTIMKEENWDLMTRSFFAGVVGGREGGVRVGASSTMFSSVAS